MALPLATTLSNACAINDTSIVVGSITSLVAGNYGKIDGEIVRVVSVPTAATLPVFILRGQEGTAQVAHSSGVQVVFGAGPSNLGAGDFPQSGAGAASIVTAPVGSRQRVITNYNAAGAITLPPPGQDAIAILDGTTILAMTLANPTVMNDGDMLIVLGNGKAAHTLTYTAGLGNVGATADVGTFNATQAQAVILIAANGFWVGPGIVSGAATIVGVGFA